MIAFSITYLLAPLTSSSILFSISAFLLVIVVCQSLLLATPVNRYISITLFLTGSFLLFYKNAALNEWIVSIGANSGLVTLFIALPFLGFPLSYEDYHTTLKVLSAKYMKNDIYFGNLSHLITYCLSALLNLGSFPIIYNLFGNDTTSSQKEKTLRIAMTRGNTAAIFWSPNYVAVAVILYYLNIPWISIVPMGLALSLAIVLSTWFSTMLRVKFAGPQPVQKTVSLAGTDMNFRLVAKLAVIFITLLSLVAFLTIFTTWNILVIVPIVAIIFPLILALIQNKLLIYRQQLHNYYSTTLSNLKNEVIIFAAAGFFGKSLEITGVGKIVPSLLQLDNIHQPFLAILAIMLVMGVLAIVGVHPVVTSSAIAASIGADTLGLSLSAYAFALLAAYGLAVLVSPFSGMSLVMSGLTKRSAWEVSLLDNMLYSVGMALFFAAVIPFIK